MTKKEMLIQRVRIEKRLKSAIDDLCAVGGVHVLSHDRWDIFDRVREDIRVARVFKVRGNIDVH